MSRKSLLVLAALVLVPALFVVLPAQDKPEAKRAQDDDPFGGDTTEPVAKSKGSAVRALGGALLNAAIPGRDKPEAKRRLLENPFGGDAPVKTATKPARPRRPPSKPAAPLHGGEKAILKALDEPAAFEFDETPLADVADFIRDKHHIPVVIDHKALEDASVGTDSPITFAISGVSLRSALAELLPQIGLTSTIRSEALVITTPEREEQHLVTRSYDIGDLIGCISDLPYQREALPTGSPPRPSCAARPLSGIGGMGTGAFSISCVPVVGSGTMGFSACGPVQSIPAMPADDIITLITSSIAPQTWDTVGGPATINPFGEVLAVNQTLEGHRQIEALLRDVRAKRQAVPGVVIDLQWLWLDAQQREQLLGGGKPSADGRVTITADPNVLEALARKAPGFRGRIVCSNGQLVHLAAGDRRVVVSGIIPPSDGTIAAQPLLQIPNVGVVAEVRATVAGAAGTALLDVQSVVTRWGKAESPARVDVSWRGNDIPPLPPPPVKEGSPPPLPQPPRTPAGAASVPVDRVIMPAQEFATTVRVPLGKPVVLGMMTFAPADDAGLGKAVENPKQLHVIATTSIAK